MKIISVEETGFDVERVNKYRVGSTYIDTYEGFVITLDNDEVIKVGISDRQSCCENWGHVQSEDDLSQYVGAELLKVEVTDLGLKKYPVIDEKYFEGGAMFVDFTTDKGVFQLAVYNDHNGYYGHEAVVISRDLNFSETL